jgi:hypothetical protein
MGRRIAPPSWRVHQRYQGHRSSDRNSQSQQGRKLTVGDASGFQLSPHPPAAQAGSGPYRDAKGHHCEQQQNLQCWFRLLDQTAPRAHTPLSISIVSSSGLVRVRARRTLAVVSHSSGGYKDDPRGLRLLTEAPPPKLGRVIAGGNPEGTYQREVLNHYERHQLFQVRN